MIIMCDFLLTNYIPFIFLKLNIYLQQIFIIYIFIFKKKYIYKHNIAYIYLKTGQEKA